MLIGISVLAILVALSLVLGVLVGANTEKTAETIISALVVLVLCDIISGLVHYIVISSGVHYIGGLVALSYLLTHIGLITAAVANRHRRSSRTH